MGSGPGRRMPSGVLKGGTFEKRGRHSRVCCLALGCRFWRSTGISLILFRGHIISIFIFLFFVGFDIFPCGLEGFSMRYRRRIIPLLPHSLSSVQNGVFSPAATMTVY